MNPENSCGKQTARISNLVAIAALIFSVVVLAGPSGTASAASARLYGTVTCPSGKAVVGVWVESSAGGSRWAPWTAFPGVPHAAYYNVTLTTALPSSVFLTVGCGGTPQKWATSNKTTKFTLSGSKVVNAGCNAAGTCSFPKKITSPTPTSYNPVGTAYKCQCTYFAAEKWKAATGSYPNWKEADGSGRIGNAINWDDNAARIGWQIGSVPRPRSLFVVNSGPYGHVGYVHDVRISGGVVEVLISDQNITSKANCADIRTKVWIRPTSAYKYIIPAN